jgi:WD40 repeat protein
VFSKRSQIGEFTSACSADGEWLLLLETDNQAPSWLSVRNTITGEEIPGFLPKTTYFDWVAWSPVGSRLLTKVGQTVKVLEVPTGKEERSFQLLSPHIQSLRWSADGKRLLGCEIPSSGKESGVLIRDFTKEPHVFIWDAATGQELLSFTQGKDMLVAEFSPDGQRVATLSSDGITSVWDVVLGQRLFSSRFPNYSSNPGLRQPRWSRDGQQLLIHCGENVEI